MGAVSVTLTIKNPLKPTTAISGKYLVDSGAHYTVLSADTAQKLGIRPSFVQEFSLADGKIIKREVGSALVRYEDKEIAVPVVIGKKGDSPLLGVTTLEAFGLMLDPFKRKIYHSRLMLA